MKKGIKQQGFTIVELLIVIVVIAILAAIVIIAYTGVQNRANDSSVQSDLRGVGAKFMNYQAINGKLPSNGTEFSASGAAASHGAYGNHYTPVGSSGYNLLLCYTSVTSETWGLVAASKSGTVYVYKTNGGVTTGTGPLATYTTTCSNNGLPSGGQWLFNNGSWVI